MPKISYIVGAFDMRRELPRTALSLCAPYQRGLDPGDIEILIADNGSTDPVDPACRHDGYGERNADAPEGLPDGLVTVEQPEQFGVGEHLQQGGHRLRNVRLAATDPIHRIGERRPRRVQRLRHGDRGVKLA